METNDSMEMDRLTYGSRETKENKVYTVQEAINTVGNGWFQLWIGLVCGLIWIADAIALLLLSLMAVVLRCEWQLTVLQSSSITTIPFVCQIIGSYIWGIYTDKYGRRSILALTTVLLFWFSVLSAFSNGLTWFLLCRCVCTFVIGGAPQAMTFFMEFLPTKGRGVFLSIFELSFSSGVIFAFVLAMLIIPSLGWRYYLIICAVPSLLAALALMTLPESPYFHASIGAAENVQRTIRAIAKWNNKSPVSGGIKMEVQEVHGSFWDLFATSQLAKSSFLLCILWICSGVQYYGIVLLTAETLGDRNACQEFRGNVETCADDCVPFNTEAYVGMIVVAVAELPSAILCIFLMDIIGRRALIIFASVTFSCCFSILFFCLHPQIITTSVLSVSKCFSQVIYIVLFAYTPEIYPTPVRGLAVGAGVAATRLGTALAPLNAQVLASHSVMSSVAVIAMTGVLAILSSVLLPVETKGQEINSTVHDSRDQKTGIRDIFKRS